MGWGVIKESISGARENSVGGMKMRLLLAAGSAFALMTPALVGAKTISSPETMAEEVLAKAPVFDGHNDVPWALRARVANVINGFDFEDTGHTHTVADGTMHTDLKRLRAGRVGAQFWSVYVPSNANEQISVQQTIEQIDVMKRLIAKYPKDMGFARNSRELEAQVKAGKIAGMLGIEGGQSIGSSLAVLREMHGMGVRYMTLTHGKNTPWADSATDDPKHGGLTEFGRNVVREMNRIGMIVDLSHVSADTMKAALAVSMAPVMFSHSGVRGVNDHPRNVPDDVLPLVRANGGIVMVVFLPSFLSAEVSDYDYRRAGEEARVKYQYRGAPEKVVEAMKAWDAANPLPLTNPKTVADHIDYLKRTIGVDHIGLGGDYDGMDSGPQQMEDVRGYPALFAELARRGYTPEELRKISSGNMMRVLKGVEAYAASEAGVSARETPATLR
jgi:membrane dipeptidase